MGYDTLGMGVLYFLATLTFFAAVLALDYNFSSGQPLSTIVNQKLHAWIQDAPTLQWAFPEMSPKSDLLPRVHDEVALLRDDFDSLRSLVYDIRQDRGTENGDIVLLREEVLGLRARMDELIERIERTSEEVGRLVYLEGEVFRLSRDFVAQPDYALSAAGTYVLQELVAVSGRLSEDWMEAEKIVDGKTGVGTCWSFPGEQAQVGLHLSVRVHIEQISIDHIPKELVQSLDHAPKEIVIWGVVDEENQLISQHPALPIILADLQMPLTVPELQVVPLATILYSVTSKTHVQTFPVLDYISKSSAHFQKIIVQVASNYGAKNTCVYRVRVHGAQHE